MAAFDSEVTVTTSLDLPAPARQPRAPVPNPPVLTSPHGDDAQPLKPSPAHTPHNNEDGGIEDELEDVDNNVERRVKKILLVALGLLAVVVVALGAGLGVYLRNQHNDSSASGSTAAVGAVPSVSMSSYPTALATPVTSQYNNSGWTGGCAGCGQYGGYGGGAGAAAAPDVNTFGSTANLSDPIECNALAIYRNLTLALDWTSQPDLTRGLRGPLLRALFHDCGTYRASAPAAEVGGCDGSLRLEMTDRDDNKGLEKAVEWVESLFTSQDPSCPLLSRADITAMSAILAASSPNHTTPAFRPRNALTPLALPFFLGRVDADAANPPGRLPMANASAVDVVATFVAEFALEPREVAALVVGSHSVGGVNIGPNAANTPPPVGVTPGRFFVGAPAVVTNAPFGLVLAQTALIPADNQMKVLASTAQWITTYAAQLTAFYADYYPALEKLSLLGQTRAILRTWKPPV